MSLRDRTAQIVGDVRLGLHTVGAVLRPAARRSPEIVVSVGLVLSVLGALILIGAARNDAKIAANPGTSVAEVLDGSTSQRTYVRFTASDGAVLTPEKGVFYPRGLEAGQLVRVQYDRTEPELVRVEGRNWTVALVPVVIGIAVIWLLCAPGAWALARWRRRRRAEEQALRWERDEALDGGVGEDGDTRDAADSDDAVPALTGAGAR
jgi:hypothetical protein